jgi:heme-degrading monooxygenase HmoA
MTGHMRVLLYASAPQGNPNAVQDVYHHISQRLQDVPGLIGNELLRDVIGKRGDFIIMSEWESAEAFRRWEEGPDHRDTTSPLRPYQDRGRSEVFGIYEVVASYR